MFTQTELPRANNAVLHLAHHFVGNNTVHVQSQRLITVSFGLVGPRGQVGTLSESSLAPESYMLPVGHNRVYVFLLNVCMACVRGLTWVNSGLACGVRCGGSIDVGRVAVRRRSTVDLAIRIAASRFLAGRSIVMNGNVSD